MDYMSDGEIITFYRQAADPKKQIGILAELNATTRETITWILKRAGVYGKVDRSPKITPPQQSALPILSAPPPKPMPKVEPPEKKEEAKPKRGRRGGRSISPERHQRLLDLYHEGLGDPEIAKRIGLSSSSSVCVWRKKYNLPANLTRGRRRVKVNQE